ncbi:hypothetical protein [Burkholderia ambifaria]|uniref:hypothetical protein n=1 Tax=Burkholderia ambifaria TaxID=152480 RepID=UPI00158AC27A|nr:hypothetical protein [Burkholderia ambifaria]
MVRSTETIFTNFRGKWMLIYPENLESHRCAARRSIDFWIARGVTKKMDITVTARILNRRYHTRLGYAGIKFNGKNRFVFCS